ncbi:putative Lanosterol 14-alpha demethylase-like protein [Naja naja]|nr:putative Lanosterol 14-alpha demethylase-like protein [Naja naja]
MEPSWFEAGGSVVERVAAGSPLSLLLAASAFALSLGYLFQLGTRQQRQSASGQKYPPYIPSNIPFLGHAIAFGRNPIQFLDDAYEKYGPVFSFTMVGKTFTYLLGSDAAALLFNSKNEELNAEEVYSRLTTPVFGKGVAYDVPNAVFLEQKKMLKSGLNIGQFKNHISIIEKETIEYFRSWGDKGKRSKCRDRAHQKLKSIFYEVIQKRRQSSTREDDMLQTLLDVTYKNGRPLTDDEIAGMLIGLLLAGQHTSSTTSTWLGFFLAREKSIQQQCYEEQKNLKDLNLLDRCLKETLRLRPPIMTMMRMAKTPQTIAGYTILPGHQICVSPTINHTLKDCWMENLKFKPDRYLQDNPAAAEKFAYVPFGAGRHRCIGENFAYIQIKTIWSTLLRLYEFDLVDGYFPAINYTTMIHTPTNPLIIYKRRLPNETHTL